MKRTIALLLALAMCTALAACTGDTPSSTTAPGTSAGGSTTTGSGQTTAPATTQPANKTEKVLIVGASTDPTHFNANIYASNTGYPRFNIFNNLFNRVQGGGMVPDLVKDYSISEDGLTYTFILHDNVKWHDGEMLTSEDVKYTYDMQLQEKGSSIDRLSVIDYIECPSDNTVVFTLQRRDADFIMSTLNVDILPSHIYAGTDWTENPANQNPIGTGPFRFVEHKKGQSVTLEAYDDYFKGRANIDKVIYKIIPDGNTRIQAFLNGEVDVLDAAAAVDLGAMPMLEADPHTEYVVSMSSDRQYIMFNLERECWDNLKVREAVAYAVNRPEMVQLAHKGYAYEAKGFYTPTVAWAYTEDYVMPERDVATANRLMDESGYMPGADGIRIKDIDIVIFDFTAFHDLATVLQANLKEIGIDCKITVLEYSAWQEKMQKGEFDLSILSGTHGPTPSNVLSRYSTGGSSNYGKYSNPRIDELFVLVGQEINTSVRAGYMHEMQKILYEEKPILPLTEWCIITVVKDYVIGHFSFHPDDYPWGRFHLTDIAE